MIKDLAKKNRSYRRFYEEKRISMEELLDMVDAARLTPSGANKQPIRYILSCDDKTNGIIFPNLRWAGYLADWDGPAKGERPTAYIIMVEPAGVNAPNDEGIAGQTILLSAVEKGMGGCFIGNIDRENLAKALNIPPEYSIKLVIALGYPKEEVVIEEINDNDDIKYYRDEKQVHHVPKVRLDDLVLKLL
jgi:nitroreductase